MYVDQEEYSEEEVTEIMAETMEQYMSKTRADYGPGIARPKIKGNDSFELKGQFLKELSDQIFCGSDHEDANEILDSSFTDAAIRNQGASIKTLEIQIRKWASKINTDNSISKSFEYGASHNSIPRKDEDPGRSSVSVMPLSTYLNLGLGELAHTKLTIELADRTVKYPKGIAENVLVGIGKFIFLVDFIILDMPEDIKVPLILERPFLSITHAKIDVFKRKITLRVGEEKISFKSVKPARSLIKRVYMLNLRERMELDLEARLMGETLVLNRSLDPFFEDYIELNDLNVPLELRRDQVDDLMPTIKEGEVVEEFRARNDARMVSKVFGYPSDCDHDKKIRIDCAYNLKFSCMIDLAVLEDMDAYRDEGMGDGIFGEPFLREVGINAKQFEGMITIHNGFVWYPLDPIRCFDQI
ncbi:putative reverse transcriptase domain-containing protein [Tanacetum coccineum]